jgi:hypothetical protein
MYIRTSWKQLHNNLAKIIDDTSEKDSGKRCNPQFPALFLVPSPLLFV